MVINMKVLVTGVKGQLGHDVVNELKNRNHTVVGVDIDEMDITDEDSVNNFILKTSPDAVIHCAAWTAVDAAEDNIDKCRDINANGTEYIAKACKILNCKMVYISTDYVFRGEGTRPWEPDDKREPLNIYGQTKYEGELAVQKHLNNYYIVRIAWVFGINGKNFIKTMLNLGKTNEKLKVVDDQIGTPTYTYDLSRLLVDMTETDKYGIYHATNEGGYISWYDFTCEIIRQAAKYDSDYSKVTVSPVLSSEYPTKTKRPFNSRLNKEKLIENGFNKLPSWQDAIARYLKEFFQ